MQQRYGQGIVAGNGPPVGRGKRTIAIAPPVPLWPQHGKVSGILQSQHKYGGFGWDSLSVLPAVRGLETDAAEPSYLVDWYTIKLWRLLSHVSIIDPSGTRHNIQSLKHSYYLWLIKLF